MMGSAVRRAQGCTPGSHTCSTLKVHTRPSQKWQHVLHKKSFYDVKIGV